MKINFIFCLFSIFLLPNVEKIDTNLSEQVNEKIIKTGNNLQKKGNCKHLNTYNLNERLSFYPFNKAIKVKIVAFKGKDFEASLIDKEGKINYKQIDEIKTLNAVQIDSLTSLVYNFGLIPNALPNNEWAKCYQPRNGILFIDKNYQVFEWMEICFQCFQHRISSKKIDFVDNCPLRYILLKDFFRKSGIEYVED
jgi:hypothetical protein